MDGEVLVIIDMQPYFETAHDEYTLRNCVTEIKKAIRDEIPIIAVEYEDPDGNDILGETLPRLKRHLDKYTRTYYVKKHQDDGGYEIMNCIEDEGIGFVSKFRVCGVNITACVAETVYTLVNEWSAEVEIIKKACNGSRSWYKNRKTMFSNRGIYRNRNVALV